MIRIPLALRTGFDALGTAIAALAELVPHRHWSTDRRTRLRVLVVERAFAAGLGCFAGAHGCYGTAFAAARQPTPPAAAAPLGIGGAVLGGALARRAGRLGAPVAGYSALITSMATGALALDERRIGRPAARRIAAGAALFLLSDGLIGLRKFALPSHANRGVRSAIDAAVMVTYAGGQWLIADGVTRAATPSRAAVGAD